MSTRNWPLLIETMQFILDHPAQWDQSVWANTCGTAYCFAGHASLLLGGRQLKGGDLGTNSGYLSDEWTDLVVVPDDLAAAVDEGTAWDTWYRTIDGRKAYSMSGVAEVALGLDTGDDGEVVLFDSDNSLGDLLFYLRAMAKADGVELPESWPTDAPLRNTSWMQGSSIDEY